MESKLLNNIKTLLGSEITPLELNDEIIKELYLEAEQEFDFYSEISNKGLRLLDRIKEVWIKKYTIALCKELISEIRSKFVVRDTKTHVFAEQLNHAAREDKRALREILIIK